MYKILKYVFTIILILSGFGAIVKGSILGGVLILIAGLVLLPPISEKLQEKVLFWKKRPIRVASIIGVLFIGFVISGSQLNSESKNSVSNKGKDNKVTQEKFLYDKYLTLTNDIFRTMNDKEKQERNDILNKIKETKTYKSLVDSSSVKIEFIPVINTIANGITYISDNGFNIDEELISEVENLPNGEDKANFVVSVISLAQLKKGGLNKELIQVFERYRNKYKIYGEPSIYYNGNAEVQEKNPYNYDFTPIFAMLEPMSKEFIEAIYKAKEKGLSDWREDKEVKYPYLTNAEEYAKRLLYVNPESKFLPRYSTADFWKEFDENVQIRTIAMVFEKDCAGLQQEFDNAMDNVERFHNAGRTSPKHSELGDFVNSSMRKIGCYKD